MRIAFVVWLAAIVAVRWWLSRRQERAVQAHRGEVPASFRGAIDLAAHQKAADYTTAKLKLGRVTLVARVALLLAWTLGGGVEFLRGVWPSDGTLFSDVMFVLTVALLAEAVLMPFSIYETFRIEQRFGFNRLTPALYISDLLRSLTLGLVLGGVVVGAALTLAQRELWIPLWAAWVGFTLLMTWAYPAFIAPLFWTFSPLPNGELKTRLDSLLERTGFSNDGLYVMDGSRRSARANAYFTGIGDKKRIVLYDTLCETLQPDELEAVLAHELGHFRLHHIRMRLIGGVVFAGGAIAALAWALQSPKFYEMLGVSTPWLPAGLLLFAWVAPLATFPLNPLFSAWSRKHEYEADEFAKTNSDGQAMVSALVKLYEHNAATLTPDPIYSAFYDSHPPAPLRVARLEQAKA